ncbi:hypothetical protein IAT38_005388 [Cryptococcus sp. DSM 104549]
MAGGIPIDPELLEDDEFNFNQAASGSEDSGIYYRDEDNSEDEYRPDEDEDEGRAQEPEEDVAQRGDQVFDRLAGFVSHAAPGELGGQEFQRELQIANDDDQDGEPPRRAKAIRAKRVHKVTHEVSVALGEANDLYLDGQTHKAIDQFLEVLRLDQYVSSAWTSLASCYRELDDYDKARQFKFLGAHVENEEDTWRELAAEFLEINSLDQAAYCIRKALKTAPDDLNLLWDLGNIYRQQDRKKIGCTVFRQLLKADPTLSHDFDFLISYHPLLLASSLRFEAATHLRTAFDYHIASYPTPASPPTLPGAPAQPMTSDNILLLVDDYLAEQAYERAVEVLRKGQRWLQGRGAQTYWDAYEDDREYDPPGTERVGEEGTFANEGTGMDTAMRLRLALARIHLGDEEDANIHVNEILLLGDVLVNREYFQQIGDALMQHENWEDALEAFCTIQDCEELPDEPDLIKNIGECLFQLKRYEEAMECYKWVAERDEEDWEARMRMASLLEEMGDTQAAYEMVSEIIRTRAHANKDATRVSRTGTTAPFAAPGPDGEPTTEPGAGGRLSSRALAGQTRVEMRELYAIVQDAERGIDEQEPGAVESYVDNAALMIEYFRLNKGNFTKSRGVVRILRSRKSKRKDDVLGRALEMQQRLEGLLGIEDSDAENVAPDVKWAVFRRTEFYGLNYEQWLLIILKYSSVMTVRGEPEIALDVLEHVVWSGLFHNRRCEIAIRLAIIGAALRTKQYIKIHESCKRLALLTQYTPAPFLLVLACFSSAGLPARKAWNSLVMQHFLGRELRLYDDAVRAGEKGLHYNAGTGRWTVNKGRTVKEKMDMGREKVAGERERLELEDGGGESDEEEHEMEDGDEDDSSKTAKEREKEARLRARETKKRAAEKEKEDKRKERERKKEETARLKAEAKAAKAKGKGKKGKASREMSQGQETEPMEVDSPVLSARGMDLDDDPTHASTYSQSKEPEFATLNDLDNPEGFAQPSVEQPSRGEDYEEQAGESTYRPTVPTKSSPYWNVFYGQQMLSNKSYQGAIFYLLRAYEACPYEPLICLQLGQAFLNRSTQRQADNKHYQIAQGLGFLARYRHLSSKDPAEQEEVEYNFARGFHSIGIYHLAAKHYEKVLESVEARMRAEEERVIDENDEGDYNDPEAVRANSLAYEAAHNLMMIYATSGSTVLVKRVSKWMAI